MIELIFATYAIYNLRIREMLTKTGGILITIVPQEMNKPKTRNYPKMFRTNLMSSIEKMNPQIVSIDKIKKIIKTQNQMAQVYKDHISTFGPII